MMVVWLTMYMVHNPSKYDDVICEQPLINMNTCTQKYIKVYVYKQQGCEIKEK